MVCLLLMMMTKNLDWRKGGDEDLGELWMKEVLGKMFDEWRVIQRPVRDHEIKV